MKRETIYAKAERMLAQGRFTTYAAAGTEYWVGVVYGDHDHYPAFAVDPKHASKHGVSGAQLGCRCKHGRKGKTCSHALTADKIRLRGELRDQLHLPC